MTLEDPDDSDEVLVFRVLAWLFRTYAQHARDLFWTGQSAMQHGFRVDSPTTHRGCILLLMRRGGVPVVLETPLGRLSLETGTVGNSAAFHTDLCSGGHRDFVDLAMIKHPSATDGVVRAAYSWYAVRRVGQRELEVPVSPDEAYSEARATKERGERAFTLAFERGLFYDKLGVLGWFRRCKRGLATQRYARILYRLQNQCSEHDVEAFVAFYRRFVVAEYAQVPLGVEFHDAGIGRALYRIALASKELAWTHV